ncbi:MAG: polysaccharide pyruvyl transferase family protein [Desulfuromonadaceae bacterium]|nr:polysaccharide pyruvyl transferase family protein [Desulfuromonadaceae bacterium]
MQNQPMCRQIIWETYFHMNTSQINKLTNRLKSAILYRTSRLPSQIIGLAKGNAVRAYWYKDIANFGDMITPLLLEHYGYTPIFTSPPKADLVSTGSILEHLPDNYSGRILGSGFIYEDSFMKFPRAQVLSVRGALTRTRLGPRRENVCLGDPGLLAPKILRKRELKRYLLGVIPHHAHRMSPVIAGLSKNNPTTVSVIDVTQQPLQVFQLIDQCEHILSSSLHGLIIADSLGIPSGWLSPDRLTGGRFKFDDYYSSLNLHAGNPHTLESRQSLDDLVALTSLKPVESVQSLQDNLHRLWSNLGDFL